MNRWHEMGVAALWVAVAACAGDLEDPEAYAELRPTGEDAFAGGEDAGDDAGGSGSSDGDGGADDGGTDGGTDGGDDDALPGCAGTVPAFLTDETRCASCHFDGSPAGAGLDLLSDGLADRLDGAVGGCPEELLINPENPTASTLVQWTDEGVDGCGIALMPPIGSELNAAELQCLIEWIDGLDGVVDWVGGETVQ